jgi:hypothetical protein
MQNRRQRREAEKKSGLMKIEKSMTPMAREEIKQRKAEYLKHMNLLRLQELENLKNLQESERWSKKMEELVAGGMSREEALAFLEEAQQRSKQIAEDNYKRQMEREERLAKRREKQANRNKSKE